MKVEREILFLKSLYFTTIMLMTHKRKKFMHDELFEKLNNYPQRYS